MQFSLWKKDNMSRESPRMRKFVLKKLIASATGPSPWYWKTFPVFEIGTYRFSWRHIGSEKPLGNLVLLERKAFPHPILGLNTYVRPFVANPEHLGLWYPHPNNAVMEILIFNLSTMQPIENFAEGVPGFQERTSRVLHSSTVGEYVQIPNRLPAGHKKGPIAHLANRMDELLLLADGPPPVRDDLPAPAASIYVWCPATGDIEVLPQEWFTAADYDLGYQWITRVTRDPSTGRIVGGGIRISDFELADNGTKVLHWLRNSRDTE